MISDPYKALNINIDHFKIPVWTYGNPKNPPVFFIHGFFNSFSQYVGDLPVRYLMKDYYVIAFDLPGFGHSKELDIDRLDFISEVQKQMLNNKKVVLFGVSYGGLLSIKYYFKNPKLVKGLIIAGTPVFRNIFKIYKLAALLPEYKGKKIHWKDFMEFDEILTKKNLKNINIPVLLYYNSADLVANIYMGKWINKNIKNSKLFISEKQNHSWLLHRIDKSGFLNEIKIFLNAIKLASK